MDLPTAEIRVLERRIQDAVPAPDDIASTVWIPGEADAGRPIVVFRGGPPGIAAAALIAKDHTSRNVAGSGIRSRRAEIGRIVVGFAARHVDVPAKADVQSQPGCDLPIVLNEKAVVTRPPDQLGSPAPKI